MKCNKCGECCRFIKIRINGTVSKDLERWFNLHNIKIENDLLNIPIPCKELDQETNLCKIYDSRPDCCKGYPKGISNENLPLKCIFRKKRPEVKT